MKTLILISTLSFIYLTAFSQGIYNNGAHIVVSADTYLVVDGASGNLQNESGAIDLTGNLMLDGNFSNNVTAASAFGTLASGSEVIFAGTGTQTIGGSSTAVFTFDKLTINSGATVQATAGKQLTLNSDLTNNGTFTIGADDDEQSTVKISGSVSGAGTYNMQAYLTSGRNWYVSSPVSGAKSSVFNAASNPVYWYDEAHGSTVPWAAITDNETDLVPFRGYIATVPTDGNVTFTGGSFNNTNQVLTLYRTAGQTKEGFNLIGNPYPAFYNFGSSTKTNIQPSYWYRAKNAGNTAYVFDTYSVTNGLGTSLSGKSVTANIPPMQAFWVRVDNGQTSGTISFDKQYVNHNDVAGNKRRAPETSNAKHIRLQVSNGVNYDEAILVFNPLASDEFDAYDSPKMSNGSTSIPEIYSKAGNEIVAINGMKTFDAERRIPLGFSTQQKTTFTIKATEISGFDAQQIIVLYDIEKGVEHDLTDLSNYEFSSSATNTLSRFELIFKVSGPSTNLINSTRAIARFVQNENRKLTFHYGGFLQGKEILTIFNVAGEEISKKQITGLETIIQLPYSAGVYLIKAELSDSTLTHKIIVK